MKMLQYGQLLQCVNGQFGNSIFVQTELTILLHMMQGMLHSCAAYVVFILVAYLQTFTTAP